jgi:hypothetical protein
LLSQVEAAVDGYCCTVFAFGQTGSGKTYTIIGPSMAGFQEAAVSAATSSRATPTPQTPVTPSSAARQAAANADAQANQQQQGSGDTGSSDSGSRPDSSSNANAAVLAAPALNEDEGLLARCVAHLYSSIDARQQECTWRVQASCCEIYNEAVTDLLARNKSQQLQVREVQQRILQQSCGWPAAALSLNMAELSSSWVAAALKHP